MKSGSTQLPSLWAPPGSRVHVPCCVPHWQLQGPGDDGSLSLGSFDTPVPHIPNCIHSSCRAGDDGLPAHSCESSPRSRAHVPSLRAHNAAGLAGCGPSAQSPRSLTWEGTTQGPEHAALYVKGCSSRLGLLGGGGVKSMICCLLLARS